MFPETSVLASSLSPYTDILNSFTGLKHAIYVNKPPDGLEVIVVLVSTVDEHAMFYTLHYEDMPHIQANVHSS